MKIVLDTKYLCDLLVLQEYEGIPLVTAREFWQCYFPEN